MREPRSGEQDSYSPLRGSLMRSKIKKNLWDRVTTLLYYFHFVIYNFSLSHLFSYPQATIKINVSGVALACSVFFELFSPPRPIFFCWDILTRLLCFQDPL